MSNWSKQATAWGRRLSPYAGLAALLTVAIAGYLTPPVPRAIPLDPTLPMPISPLPSLPPAPAPTASGDRLTTADGTSEIALLPGWSDDKTLNDRAELQVSDRSRQLYLIVLSQPKAALQGMTLATYSSITRGYLTKRLETSEISGPTSVTVVGSYPAVQYKIQGALSGIRVVYLHTVVETPTRFAQILAWMPPEAFEAQQPELQRVIQSYREQTQ